MTFFQEIISNKCFWVALLGWAIAQGIKVILDLIRFRRFNASRVMSSGGMPSSHSAMVVALTISVGKVSHFDSPLFAACAIMSFIIMYDAAGVRRSSGNQAVAINLIFDIIEEQGGKIDKKLKEILGHSPIEVFAGAVLGALLGIFI